MSALQLAVWPFKQPSGTGAIGPLGLECALDALHLVQMETGAGGRPVVRAGATVPYGEDREAVFESPKRLRQLVGKALSADRFRGRRVATAMPNGSVRMLTINYSPAQGQGDAQAIAKVMADRLEGELGEYVLDYLPIRADRQAEDRLALVAVARRDNVLAYLELLRKAGLRVESLEIGPSALRRLISALPPGDTFQNVLAINFGRSTSYLTLISGARLLFDQEVRFGETALLDRIAQSLGMDEAQARQLVLRHGVDGSAATTVPAADDVNVAATLQDIVKPAFLELVGEINRALIYAASETRGESVRLIYLLGSVARWQGAGDFLQSLLALPVQTIPDPLVCFSAVDSENTRPHVGAGPELAVAAGLALRGLVQSDV